MPSRVRISRMPERVVGTSAANTQQTVSTSTGEFRRVLLVTVTYSASATVDVTATLNSGAGAAYDNLLQTIALSAATDGTWIPDEEVILADDDVLDVLAPAGGAGITSAVAIYTEVL